MKSNKIWLIMPFTYGFNTRARTKVHKISFAFVVIMPIWMNVYFLTNRLSSVLQFAVAFYAVYSVYEIGYIYNDVYTTQKEQNPTNWTDDDLKNKVQKYYPLMISNRVLCTCVAICILMWMGANNVSLFVLSLGLLDIVFSFHNYFRGPQNVITDLILQIIKYGAVIITFSSNWSLLLRYEIFIFIEICFIRTIEYAIGKNYLSFNQVRKHIDRSRVAYYTITSLFTTVLICTGEKTLIPLLIGLCYFAIYRVLCLLISKNKQIGEEREKNNTVVG